LRVAAAQEIRLGVVLGTAGHIDHGKTALVKALTGVDTDRLREEKERGISIDLGFTHLALPGAGLDVGVVDVPGHERFVKNMLAGAGGIDLVLMVVASDEGVMPQTREHLDICLLLGIERAVVAMTKIDLAEPELVELAVESVRELMAGTPYERSPVVRVSSVTGEGLDELRAVLIGALSDVEGRKAVGAFRMPVDRSFVKEGFGTVITGTTWSGRLRVGDPVEVLPSGIRTRVRSIQVHGSETREVTAGHRTAVALHGVHKSAVGRGDWAVAPGAFAASHMLDVTLSVIRGAERPLKTRARVRFHLGASEIMGRVVLLESDELEPGASGLAQMRLEAPAVAAKGDRFVIRAYSPARTIGGGTVLVPVAQKHRRHDEKVIDSLTRQAAGAPVEDLQEAVSRAGTQGASLDTVSRHMGMEIGALRSLAAEKVETGELVSLGGEKYVTAGVYKDTLEVLAVWIGEYQVRYPLRWGVPKGELKSRATAARIGPGLFEIALEGLRAGGRLYVKSDRLRVDSPEPSPDEATRSRLSEIEAAYRAAGYSPPTMKELASGAGSGLDGRGLSEALEFLVMEGRLVKISPEMFFHADTMSAVRERVEEHFHGHDKLGVPEFKDLVGASRKFAVPLLEYLDRVGLTRRVGDYRAPGRLLRDKL
jgi:selenocysteine-specific elongation factor